MKRELKAGMRGRVYGCDVAGVNRTERVVEIIEISGDHWVFAVLVNEVKIKIHRRQFVPFKERKSLREIWVNEYGYGLNIAHHPTREKADIKAIPGRLECIHFREVRKKVKA